MFQDKSESLKKNLESGHVLHTLISEHEIILEFLNELEKANIAIQKNKKIDEKEKIIEKLKHIAECLVETELHHKREEDVLFSEVEKAGIIGPTEVMRQEHSVLKEKKKELKELVGKLGKVNNEELNTMINDLVNFIVPTLRDHISKENDILYPCAYQSIPQKENWKEMKKRCDKIGYCCFTPGK